MPLKWKIDPRRRRVTATAVGDVVRAEVETFLQEMIDADALAFTKLFDGSLGETSMEASELIALGVRFRSLHRTNKVGALAVVVPPEKFQLIARVLGMLAAADRPMRVFNALEPAEQWILSQTPAAG